MERLGATAILGAVALLAGVLLVVILHAPPLPIVAGVLIGTGLLLLGLFIAAFERPGPVEEEPAPAVKPIQPQVDDVLGAVDDPLLLVEGRTVVRANAAALATLGQHVVGEDIRLAIRHPAAAELLARDLTLQGSVEVIGIGDAERHWTLSVQPLGLGTRIVRLVDRTSTHATDKIRVDFVANASHELRTPLASLIGFIETLEDANGPNDAATRQRFLGIMAGEARRMQRLVDDLISLSRIEADKHRAPADALALAALIRETADTLRGTRGGAQRVTMEVDDALPPVAGDRAQLSQLLYNLIGNALKYGDPARPVRVSLKREDAAMLKLVVADEGEGIDPRHLPRLTERFYRVDPGRSRAVGGTGLGLAIVKHIVERHRGRLDISSAKGVGTTVTVMLPIAAEQPVPTPLPAAAE